MCIFSELLRVAIGEEFSPNAAQIDAMPFPMRLKQGG
jgi:hypothetical protein